MYVMQITGTGAVKTSASSTQRQLQQQENGWQLQPQTRTRARKRELANMTRQTQFSTHTWMRTGKCEWGRVSKHKQERGNRCGQMRAGECKRRWGSNSSSSSNSGSPLPPFYLFIFSLSDGNCLIVSLPITIVIIIIIFIINICEFRETPPGHRANRGTVWKIPTHGIPVPNPTWWSGPLLRMACMSPPFVLEIFSL